MLRGIWGDPDRYIETYWEKFGDRYFAGDGARLDDDGDLWLLGRVDDVMNVSGHRLSTAEIESALVSHPIVAESAVIGANDETTGQAVVASIALKPTSSILIPGHSVNLAGEPVEVVTKGRHDPCVGIRATPIAEAMMALVLMDHALRHRAQCGDVGAVAPRIP